MITHEQEQNIQTQDINCAKSKLKSTKELGSRAGNGRKSRENFFPTRCHMVKCSALVTAGGQKVWELGLSVTSKELSLPSFTESWRESPIWQPSHYLHGLSLICWSTGTAQSSERLSGWRTKSSHTWIYAAPISCRGKVCSDIKQSVSISVPETAGMMSGPHRGSGGNDQLISNYMGFTIRQLVYFGTLK